MHVCCGMFSLPSHIKHLALCSHTPPVSRSVPIWPLHTSASSASSSRTCRAFVSHWKTRPPHTLPRCRCEDEERRTEGRESRDRQSSCCLLNFFLILHRSCIASSQSSVCVFLCILRCFFFVFRYFPTRRLQLY